MSGTADVAKAVFNWGKDSFSTMGKPFSNGIDWLKKCSWFASRANQVECDAQKARDDANEAKALAKKDSALAEYHAEKLRKHHLARYGNAMPETGS